MLSIGPIYPQCYVSFSGNVEMCECRVCATDFKTIQMSSTLHLKFQDIHQSTQILPIVIQTHGNITGKIKMLTVLKWIKNRDMKLFLSGMVSGANMWGGDRGRQCSGYCYKDAEHPL